MSSARKREHTVIAMMTEGRERTRRRKTKAGEMVTAGMVEKISSGCRQTHKATRRDAGADGKKDPSRAANVGLVHNISKPERDAVSLGTATDDSDS